MRPTFFLQFFFITHTRGELKKFHEKIGNLKIWYLDISLNFELNETNMFFMIFFHFQHLWGLGKISWKSVRIWSPSLHLQASNLPLYSASWHKILPSLLKYKLHLYLYLYLYLPCRRSPPPFPAASSLWKRTVLLLSTAGG